MKKLQIYILFFLNTTLSVAQENWINLITPQHIHEIVEIDDQLYCASEGGLIVYDQLARTVSEYMVKDGVPSHRVEDIAQDAAGNVWIGTYDNGLARMTDDGWDYLEIDLNVIGQLKIYCLEFDNNDVLWVGTSLGLFKYENDTWTQASNSYVLDMAKDPQGIIYTAGHLPGKLEDGVHTEYNEVFACGYSSRINCGQNGELYWASDLGVDIYDGTTWTKYTFNDIGLSYVGANTSPLDIIHTTTGDIWVAFLKNGIYKFDGTNWTEIYTFDNVTTHAEFIETANGDFVVSIDNKLYEYDNGLNELVDMSVGFNRNDIKMTKNQQGEILVLSDKQVIQYDAQLNLTVLPIPPELESYTSLDFLPHPDGSIGFINMINGETYYNGQIQTNTPSGFSGLYGMNDYMVDSKGAYWFAIPSALIRNYQGTITVYNAANSPFTEDTPMNPDLVNFHTVTEDRNGDIWASSSTGVARWESVTESWVEYHDLPFKDMPDSKFSCIYFDENNVLWAGYFGLTSFDGNTWTSYTSQNSNLEDDEISDIQKINGQLVLATETGMSIFDGTNFTNFNRDNSGIGSTHSVKIEEDGRGNTWIAAKINGITGHGGISIYNSDCIDTNNGDCPPPPSGCTSRVADANLVAISGEFGQFANDKFIKNFLTAESSYIKYRTEIHRILESKDARYAKVNKDFDKIKDMAKALLFKSFVSKRPANITVEHIKVMNDFLVSLNQATNKGKLKDEITKVRGFLHVMKNKEIKDALIAFDRAELTQIQIDISNEFDAQLVNTNGQEPYINYHLTSSGTVNISLYNANGQQIKLMQGNNSEGHHQIPIDKNGLSAGIYFIHIEYRSNNGIQIKKVFKLPVID